MHFSTSPTNVFQNLSSHLREEIRSMADKTTYPSNSYIRNALFTRAKTSGGFSKCNRFWNKTVSQLRRAKKAFFQKINPKQPTKFEKACKLLYQSSKSSIPVLRSDYIIALSSTKKAEFLNTYFTYCINTSYPPLNPFDSLNSPHFEQFPENLLCKEQFIYESLASLDVSRSSGPDSISAYILKYIAASIASSITELFNSSLKLGSVPQQSKEARVVSIPKVPVPKSPDNYRPISLLSLLSKILEKHLVVSGPINVFTLVLNAPALVLSKYPLHFCLPVFPLYGCPFFCMTFWNLVKIQLFFFLSVGC